MMAAGVLVHPKLYRSAGDILTQVANFERVEVPAAELVDILAAYDADEALRLAPALGPAGGAAPPTLNVWKALPTHQKVACLFMKGVPIREAVRLVARLLETIPAGQRAAATQLANWIRAAATCDGAAQPTRC